MADKHEDAALSPEERQFREYLTRGDDFCRIELFRYAVDWYRKAVEMRPGSEEARLRFQECRGKIRSESKTILIIVAVAACIILAISLLR